MKYKWINQKNNKNLIIFFNGWGMDESVVKHLESEENDVLMFYDYNTLEIDFDFSELNIYDKKYLIAWSMGVMTATLFDINYEKKIAINGTLKPIDNNFGIPERIYNLTLKGFSPKGTERFLKNMYKKDEIDWEKITIYDITKREFENQKSELEALTHYEANESFKYDKIIISSEDLIIPTKNQVAFWNESPNINSGHSPFNHFRKWGELL